MKRVIAGLIALSGCAAVLMACSSSHGSTPGTSVAASGGSTVATSGGSTEVKVDGNDLPGLDANSVTCVKQGGTITIASGQISGQQGLAVAMTDGSPPQVQTLSMFVDGNVLAVNNNNLGMKVGSATVSVSGNTYTITGEAQGADIKNPMNGMVTKKFSIKVSCS